MSFHCKSVSCILFFWCCVACFGVAQESEPVEELDKFQKVTKRFSEDLTIRYDGKILTSEFISSDTTNTISNELRTARILSGGGSSSSGAANWYRRVQDTSMFVGVGKSTGRRVGLGSELPAQKSFDAREFGGKLRSTSFSIVDDDGLSLIYNGGTEGDFFQLRQLETGEISIHDLSGSEPVVISAQSFAHLWNTNRDYVEGRFGQVLAQAGVGPSAAVSTPDVLQVVKQQFIDLENIDPEFLTAARKLGDDSYETRQAAIQ